MNSWGIRVVGDEEQFDTVYWPEQWPHEAPEQKLTIPEAHQAMQRHKGCRRDECARKGAAFNTLVAAGKIQPDASRTS
jgi:hypothetical protein